MSDLVVQESNAAAIAISRLNEDEDLVRRTIAKDCTEHQFQLFMAVCHQTGLSAINKQIYPVIRRSQKYGPQMTIQTGIDGLRLIAQRSGEYEGQGPIQWCGEDGHWVDVWLKQSTPAAARASVYRKGFKEPLVRTVLFKSYCQTYDGKPQGLWQTMPEHMLGKCAESAAIRAAFPQETSGLYTKEEMMQADSVVVDVKPEVTQPADRPVGSENNVRFRTLAQETGMSSDQIKMIAQSLGLSTVVAELTTKETERLESAVYKELDEAEREEYAGATLDVVANVGDQ